MEIDEIMNFLCECDYKCMKQKKIKKITFGKMYVSI
jgi:hypothetical protein